MKIKEPKKEDKPAASEEFSMQDFADIMKENRDPREMALAINAQNLWDKNKLNMISRLDDELRLYIVKLYIISKFYHHYWSKASVDIRYEPVIYSASTHKPLKTKTDPIGTYVVMEKKVKEIDPIKVGEIDPTFDDLRNTILELTIAKNGLGRTEALQVIGGMEQRLSFMDRMRSGANTMMGR